METNLRPYAKLSLNEIFGTKTTAFEKSSTTEDSLKNQRRDARVLSINQTVENVGSDNQEPYNALKKCLEKVLE